MKTKTPQKALAVASPMTLSASGITVTETGLTVSASSTFEDLMQGARIFSAARRSLDFWCADLLAAGNKSGDGERIAEQLGLDFAETRRAVAVASVAQESRRKELSSEHHYVVGRADLSPEEQAKWLNLAVAENLSAPELAKSIKLGAVAKSAKNAGLHTLSALKVQFFAWKRQFESNRRLEDLSAAEAGALLEEMEPILDFAEALGNLASQMEMEVCE
jgi:hypothetical protein